jgi:hypothetical protein
VRRVALRSLEALALPTAGFVVALALAPGRAELWGHLYLVAVLAVVLGAVVALIHAAQPPAAASPFETALRRPVPASERLPELARLEREVELAAASSFDVHFRLRPVLREVAGGLLTARRGIDLDFQPERARDALGAETYELVRADTEPPEDRHGPGMEPDRLRRVISAMESL